MASNRTRTWAYALTVAGGALILGGALMMALFWTVAGSSAEGWWMPGGHMMGMGFPFGWFILWGAVAGAAVLWSGLRMRPGAGGEGTLEGIVAIVASILSFPAMGGFMFGALFGVVGGALSLAAAEQASRR